ncbi:hypothetical protein HanXRQr2_Chr07g0297151 [Helianthus annuus]|uniref:Uncharacterized protein n=1 Tax=Helianthus annuus TaxID=4232 RepID=A0A9K3NGC3_HELAN|nr:hypothetical protein HanXRQr2_Chr07g0297151 [Helianthus annuus]
MNKPTPSVRSLPDYESEQVRVPEWRSCRKLSCSSPFIQDKNFLSWVQYS